MVQQKFKYKCPVAHFMSKLKKDTTKILTREFDNEERVYNLVFKEVEQESISMIGSSSPEKPASRTSISNPIIFDPSTGMIDWDVVHGRVIVKRESLGSRVYSGMKNGLTGEKNLGTYIEFQKSSESQSHLPSLVIELHSTPVMVELHMSHKTYLSL